MRARMPGLTVSLLLVLTSTVPARSQSPARREPQAGPTPAGLSTPAAARFAGTLTPCRVPQTEEPMLCGTFEVPEDRSGTVTAAIIEPPVTASAGRRIRLNIVVMPATSTSANVLPDPVVYLAGGGVIPATRYVPMFSRTLAALRPTRDIVLVDQRGTGKSNALACPNLTPGPPRPETQARHLDELRACRTALDARADLRHYGTVQAVDDLAEVLTWLGYRQVNLYGMSYGTKAAQIFLQRHPARVRSVTLHGAMALDAPMWLDLARAAQQSFEGVAKACAVDARCGAAYGDLRAKLQAVVTKLASSPVEAQGETESGLVPVRIDDRAIRDLLNVMLTSSRGIRDVPFMVHDMAEGRFAMPASIIAQESGAAPPLIPKGLFLTLLCGESMPQVDRAAIDGATAGTLVGDFPLRYQLAECGVWPTGATQASLYQPVRSDAPALLLTGELDNTTPPAYAERVAAGLPRGRVLRLPARSHNDVDACVTGLIAAFIAGGDAAAVDTSCVAATPPLVFRLPAAR